jgi:hypothetical protein
MQRFRSFFARGRHAALVAAAAGAALVLAATRGDTAAAPSGDSIASPGSPGASVPQLAWVRVRITSPVDPTVGGVTVRFAADEGSEKLVADNGPSDYDSRLGYIKAAMPSASSYTACIATPPNDHGAEPGTCKAKGRAGASVDLGDLAVAESRDG